MCLQQWFGLGILDDISRQARARETKGVLPTPVQSEQERIRAEQKGRNDRAIALIAESVTKTLDQTEALTQQLQTLKENAVRLQATLEDAMRRRDAGENFDVNEVDQMIYEQVPASKTVAHSPVPRVLSLAPLGMEWPKIAAEEAPMTKAQRADLATKQEKDAYRVLYAAKVRQ